MSKGYWIGAYRAVSDPEVLVAYSKLAGPAGGRFLVRGPAEYVHEAGIKERMVIVEFESLDKAIAAPATRVWVAAGFRIRRMSKRHSAAIAVNEE
jgi:uncharacterized protein (DUF1330 family)